MHLLLGTLLVVLGLLAAIVPVAVLAMSEPGWGRRSGPAGTSRRFSALTVPVTSTGRESRR